MMNNIAIMATFNECARRLTEWNDNIDVYVPEAVNMMFIAFEPEDLNPQTVASASAIIEEVLPLISIDGAERMFSNGECSIFMIGC